jgi:hypothetical protein
MRELGLACVVAIAIAQAGCGDGGTIVVPCEAARCNESCVAMGDRAGECRTDMCVCIPDIDIPPGPTQGLSSGGTVVRSSAGFQVELTIGSVSPAAEGTTASGSVELGIPPQTDPERLGAP